MRRERPTVDHRPGALPDIHTSPRDVTFVMTPAGTHGSARLIIRCDESGEVWVSIADDRRPGT